MEGALDRSLSRWPGPVLGKVSSGAQAQSGEAMRINKVIELLEQRQPVYFEFVEAARAGDYDGGRLLAQT